ncbi:hypothetical protein ACIREO_25965 [Streptomyces sp. NPDC102441]|uniref:GH85 family endohexosaminidase C-terminal domain-containing protein n=1 Tax=Streptomyces sp. NPDC102441 TaxID=3366176 RepID=UPI003814DC50
MTQPQPHPAAPTRLSGTVHALGIRLTGAGAVRWRLGALAVRDTVGKPHAPTAPRITDAAADGSELRLRWNRAPGPVRHYEVHQILPDGTRRFLGGTCGTAFFLSGVRREADERSARFQVRAVDELYGVSDAAVTAHRW